MDIKENTGVMFPNKNWTEGSNQPRVRGEINVGGKIMEIAMWSKKSANGNAYYSLSLKDKQEAKPVEKPVKASKPQEEFIDDAIPF